MYTFLNAGFGQPLGKPALDYISSLGFTGIRTDIPMTGWEPVVDELNGTGLSPIFLFGGGSMYGWTPEIFFDTTAAVAKRIKKGSYFSNVPVFFEIGNEPDIAVPTWKDRPQYLADTFWECYRYVKAICGRIELITGGISNLHKKGLDWLHKFIGGTVQDKAIIGFHRYPNGTDMTIPHNGFQSREHEWNRLCTITGGRRLFCTEAGMSTGPHHKKKGFLLCWLNNQVYLTEVQQAEAFRIEYCFHSRRSSIGMVWYQHRNGPKDTLLDHYGILNVDGSEKLPVCNAIRKVLL